MKDSSPTTLETILSKIDDIPPGQHLGKGFELAIRYDLTFKGQPATRSQILNMVHDKLYAMGYEPDGFREHEGTTTFKYTPVDRGHLEVGYYNELQNRLFNLFLHVSCDKRNFSTFSIALASIFLDAGSFFDSLAQTFIRNYSNAGNSFLAESKIPNFRRKIAGKAFFTMEDYRHLFEADFKFSEKLLNLNCHGGDFYSQPTAFFRDPTRRFDITPYADWSSGKNPQWWRAYTRVKHDRIKYLEEATLGNTIMAFGAVLIVLSIYHARFMKSHPQALETYRLLTPQYWKLKAVSTVMRPDFTEVTPTE